MGHLLINTPLEPKRQLSGLMDVFQFREHIVADYEQFTCRFTRIRADDSAGSVVLNRFVLTRGLNRHTSFNSRRSSWRIRFESIPIALMLVTRRYVSWRQHSILDAMQRKRVA